MGGLDERRDGQLWSDTEGLRWGGGSNRGSNRGDPANTRINATTGGWGGRQAKARDVAKVLQNLDAQFFDRLIQNISYTIVKRGGVSANDGGAGVPTHVPVAAIFAMLTERGIVPKTSSPQQSFKDVIRAHFSSPFPMPAHIVNRVMKTYAGRDGTDLDLVRLLRDLRFLISEREQEPRSQSSVGSSPQSSPRSTRDGWHDACDQDQYWRTIRKLEQTAPRAGYTGNATQGNGGWQPVPWADNLPAERKKQSADTKESKWRRKLLLSKIRR